MDDRISQDAVSPTDLPTTGQVVYRGVGRVNFTPQRFPASLYLGDALVTADFELGQVSGRLSNFIDENDAQHAGEIIFEAADINLAADADITPTFTDSVSGQVAEYDGRFSTVSGVYVGDF